MVRPWHSVPQVYDLNRTAAPARDTIRCMRPSRRHPLLLPALLCALALLAAGPTAAKGDSGDPEGLSTEVVRLFEEASAATRRYEAGRREAEVQRARAQRLERLLARERRNIAVLHGDLGRIAREQYRNGGGFRTPCSCCSRTALRS